MKNKIRILPVAALVVCAFGVFAPAGAARAEGLSDAQKEEINGLIGDYIKAHPEAIMDSVNDYQRNAQERARQSAEQKVKEYQDYYQKNDIPVVGNPDGDVTLVEYFDYNCGYCKKAFSDVMKLLDEDPDLRIVFQDLPVLGSDSETIARMSLAAHKQGKYLAFHKAMMGFHGNHNAEGLFKLAEETGLDVEKLKNDMQDPMTDLALQNHRQMAGEMGINGTPAFIIGGELYPGYIGYDMMKQRIDAIRKAAE